MSDCPDCEGLRAEKLKLIEILASASRRNNELEVDRFKLVREVNLCHAERAAFAAERDGALKAAVLAEREACAMIAEAEAKILYSGIGCYHASVIAEKIRASEERRGKPREFSAGTFEALLPHAPDSSDE